MAERSRPRRRAAPRTPDDSGAAAASPASGESPAPGDAHASAAPRTWIRHWPLACWVFILAAIGVVQVVRLQWFDSAVFAVAVLGVVLVARDRRPHRAGVRIALAPLAGAVAIVGAMLCFLPRHSLLMQLMMVAAGIAATALAWAGAAIAHPDRPTNSAPGIRRLAWSWGAILVVGCVWELIQFILGLVQPDVAWFALSDLLNPAVATDPGKIVFIVLWLSGGAWLLRRGGAR